MHIGNSIICPVTGIPMLVVAGVTAFYAYKKAKKNFSTDKVFQTAALTVMVFAMQMINFAIPQTGSSGHIIGSVLLAALLSPSVAFLAMCSILLVQTVFFADGGLLALGCNIFNMGILACFVAYPLFYKPLADKNRPFLGAVVASIIALQLGSLAVVTESALSGSVTLSGVTAFAALMQSIHLPIGIAEGFITGGIDSTLLLYLCRGMNILALTFNSDFQTEEEIKLTKDLCEKYAVEQIIIEQSVFDNSIVLSNPKDRCYHCKKFLFEKAIEAAKVRGLKNLIDGTNFDDLGVYRPGRRALAELGVISPFVKFEITKKEIRDYAKESGIEIFNKPSSPCLATRFPYGEKLTAERLKVVAKGEQILKKFGFECCRLRMHSGIGRIEIQPEYFGKFLQRRKELIIELKKIGIKYLTLDIEGFRSGSMDL